MTELRSRGIQPDVIVCRSDQPISEGLKRKVSLLCDVPIEAVVSAVDARSIYEIPLVLHEEGLEARWERHIRNAAALRAGFAALGLTLVAPEGHQLPQLSVVRIPEGVATAQRSRRLTKLV